MNSGATSRTQPFDLLIENVRLAGFGEPLAIGVAGGLIAAMSPDLGAAHQGPRYDGGGAFAFPGFVESHIHLDKAGIMDRCAVCEGTLAEAVALTARAKAGFTREDVYRRAASVVEKAVLHGTNRMRTFVEVDPRAGFRSFEAIKAIKADYAWACDIRICAFAQEGLTQEPATLAMLRQALSDGADLVGGCPYTDTDPVAHVSAIFDLAAEFAVAVDFHADFDLDPENSILPEIIRQTRRRGYEGRVSAGHVTKLSAMTPDRLDALGRELAAAGIAVTVLPATDLFLLGRSASHLTPRGMAPAEHLRRLGVLTTAATNNVLNPFTPYGDVSLCRMANFYANVAQLASDAQLEAAFDMVTANAARLMGVEHDLRIGGPADLVLASASDGASAVREIAPVLAGWKNGRQTFVRARARLLRGSQAIPALF